MKDIKFEEITIIGPGLIGASLGLILKNKKIAKKIVGIDVSKKNIKDAINNKTIDEGRLKIDEKIRRSNFQWNISIRLNPLVYGYLLFHL